MWLIECLFPIIGSHTAQDPALALFSTTPVLGGDYTATCTLTVDSEISLEEISPTVTIHWLGEFGMFTKLPTVWSSVILMYLVYR